MGFVASFLWALALMVVGELLRPKQKPEDAKAASIDDFSFPTTSADRNWPWFCGTVKIDGPNLTWYGDLRSEPVKKKVKTGLFSSKRVTIAHRYYLGLEMFLGVEYLDDISEIRFGTEMPSQFSKSVTADEFVFSFNARDFFGGDEEEGGVAGTVRVARGSMTQNANSYLQTKLGRLRSAYRGLSFAVFEAFYFGTRETIKPISFIAHRYPNSLGLTSNRHIINSLDANPACMIYELLTNSRWGASIATAKIDTTNFVAIGNKLYDEGYGMSMLINNATSASGIISEILRHIDGVMYTDNETGLLTLALARDDYDVNTLPVFEDEESGNDGGIKSFQWSRQSWSETKNMVIINFIDRDQDFKEQPIPIRETANIQARGGIVDSENIDLTGFANATTALKRGSVAAKTLSYPLMNATMVVDGRGWNLRPGSVIKVNWSPDGIQGIVLRVVRTAYQNGMRNRIELSCVEDVFSVGEIAYIVPPPSNWQNPVGPPQPLVAQYANEAPFHILGTESRQVVSFGSRFSGIDVGYEAWHDPSGGSNFVYGATNGDFTPTGVISAPYPANTAAIDTTGFVLSSPRDMNEVGVATNDEMTFGDSLALIQSAAGEEWIAFKTPTDNGNGTYTISTVWRGVLDSVPLTHPSDARVWFYSYGAGTFSETPYGSNGNITGRLRPYNVRGLLALGSATTLTVNISQRAWKPYPPGNVKINSVTWPTTINNNAVATWAHRHRLDQTTAGVIVTQDSGNYSAAPEGNYTVRVYVGGTLRATQTGVTGTTYTYNATQRVSDDSDGYKLTRIRIEPVNGSFIGQYQEREFLMIGLGMVLGDYLGGVAP